MKRIGIFAIVILIIGAIIMVPMARKGKKIQEVAVDAGIPVQIAMAHTGTIESVIDVSGDIKALKSAVLSAKMPGRVVAVPYREGDSVRAGAAVVRQDTSDLQTQVLQAQAGLQAANARLSQASTSAGLSDTQVEAGIAQAKAGLDAAKARLQMIKKGARSQEVASAENAVASAKAGFGNAKVNLERTRGLYSEGAISKQQMDLVQMQYDVADAQYDTAVQQLSLVKAGAREEEIEAAQKQMEQAEEALRIAKSGRGNTSLREEDIKSARAGVEQAKASLAYAKQQLANAYIKTPIAGTISKREIEPGEMANPGIPLIEVVALSTVYFEANVSEMDIDKVKIGQPVSVVIDALRGRKFMGTVKKVLPTADSKSRQFVVRIEVLNRSGDLRPGMFAQGKIEIARHKNTVIIPKDALVESSEGQSVYTVDGAVAKLRPVRTGFENREEVEVLSGVSTGEELVVSGQGNLSDGVKVNATH